MKCAQIGEQLMDMAAGSPVKTGAEEHLRGCAACAARLQALRQTMDLLDEWQAPEPSPYFAARLQARLREEARPQPWLGWLRKPVLALAMMLLLAVGGMLVIPGHLAVPVEQVAPSAPGTAVGDLQVLDKNHDLLANFDLLDDLPAGEPDSGTP
jgi:anti-sigma factor RsiW